MKRRALLLASGALAAIAAARAGAQPKKPRIIGWLFASTKEIQRTALQDFSADLARLGHVEGRDYVIEGRWSNGGVEPLTALARELVALKPAVIITAGSAAISALQKESNTVPIVFASVTDPIALGFVASLARPGGNITGVMLRGELNGKVLELMREILPGTRRVALLAHERDPVTARMFADFTKAATALKFDLVGAPVAKIEDVDQAFSEAVKSKCGAMFVPQFSLFLNHTAMIGALSTKVRLPLFSTWRSFTTGGGFLSYYAPFREIFARCAVLADKILRGASPAELPVEQPDRYALVINMKTAKALGIKVPQSVLIRADKVIE